MFYWVNPRIHNDKLGHEREMVVVWGYEYKGKSSVGGLEE